MLRATVQTLSIIIATFASLHAYAATNTTLIGQSATVAPASAGSSATYTLRAKVKNRNGANILVGNTITLTLPVGGDATTITSGTFDLDSAGSPAAIPLASMTRTATSVSFPSPAAIAKNKIFRLVLNGLKNPTVPAAYTASIVTGNSSGGTNTGNKIFSYTIAAGAATKLSFSVQPTNTASRASIFPALQVTILDAIGNRVTNATNIVIIAIGTNPAAGTLAGTLSVAAVNGIATFPNLSIDNVGSGYTLPRLPPCQ